MDITISKGKHYDLSLCRLYYRFIPFKYKRGKVISFTARILSEPYDIRPDADQHDRHKLCGINLNFWRPSDINSIMLSFQANPEKGTWDLSPYVNVDGNFVPYAEVQSKPGDEIQVDFKMVSRNKIEVYMYINGVSCVWNPYFYIWDNAKIQYPALILSWHGGKDNDGNGIGGVSPEDIRIELDIKK